MAIRPFANAPHADRNSISVSWLIGVQTGNTPNAVNQMKYLTVDEFTAYVRSTYGSMWNYRGESSSATPTDPMRNDYFLATATFTVSDTQYLENHLYAYDGNVWGDVSRVLTEYAKQEQVTDIDNRLTNVEVKVQALGTGITIKGDCTYAQLPATGQEVGDMWWVTDESAWYVYSEVDGWIPADYMLSATPSVTDTTHALTNAKATQMHNDLSEAVHNLSHWEDSPNNDVVFEGDLAKTWEDMERQIPVAEHDATADVSEKAIQDEDGNNIKSTYAKKVDYVPKSDIVDNLNSTDATKVLSAKQGKVLDDKASDLKSALTAIDHRLENIEQSKGDYIVSTYKDGSTTPSGKGNWAVVEGLRGVSRVENNLVQNGDFSSTSGWVAYNCTISATNNELTITRTGTGPEVSRAISDVGGHTVLVFFTVTQFSANNRVRVRDPFAEGSYRLLSNGLYCAMGVANENTVRIKLQFYDMAVNDVVKIKNLVLADLSVYFGGTIPSDADTIAKIQTNYPHLLTPSEYGVRIVDSSYSGVRAWARNLWNEVYEEGDINYNTGVPQANSDYIRSVNFCKVTANTSIYVKANNTIWLLWYDANYNYLGGTASDGSAGGTVVTSPANARYFKLVNRKIVFDGKICINVSDSQNGTYTPYFAPNTLSFPSTSLKSAGSVAEMYYPETGEQTKPLGSYTFDGTEFWEERSTSGGAYYMYWNGLASTIKAVASSSDLGDILSADYVRNSQANIYAGTNGIAIGTDGSLRVYDPSYNTSSSASAFATHMTGKTIRFALKEADPSTFVTPIIDNTLLTEAYGRMSTVQTGTVVDGSFDMGFINL